MNAGVPRLVLACALLATVAGDALAERDPYHSVEQINARLRALAARHHRLARAVRVTRTAGGRDVVALEVSLDGRFRPRAPVLLLHGGMHGMEWIGSEVVLHLAELVLASREPLFFGLRFHFVPVVNADGFARGKREAIGRDSKPYDPNRDFPVPFADERRSQPLVEALRAYARRGRLAGVLDYHAPAECFLWPWAFSPDQEPPDVGPLKRVVERMARSVGYCFGQTARVISYRHQGTAQDYFAHAFGAAAVLMELGYTEEPEADSPPQELIEQERPFRIFVRWLKQRAARPPPAAGR